MQGRRSLLRLKVFSVNIEKLQQLSYFTIYTEFKVSGKQYQYFSYCYVTKLKIGITSNQVKVGIAMKTTLDTTTSKMLAISQLYFTQFRPNLKGRVLDYQQQKRQQKQDKK